MNNPEVYCLLPTDFTEPTEGVVDVLALFRNRKAASSNRPKVSA